MAYYLFPRRSAHLKRQLYMMVGKGHKGVFGMILTLGVPPPPLSFGITSFISLMEEWKGTRRSPYFVMPACDSFTSRQVWLTPVKVSSFLDTRSCRSISAWSVHYFPRCSDCDKLMLSELWREYYRLGLA
ncbi:hypothetical protein NC651_036227 [Populus alba x Populus x berolinensis]|nr:hypothetical protein NC651_036227 [Populus alba x Populus x berolinensis]